MLFALLLLAFTSGSCAALLLLIFFAVGLIVSLGVGVILVVFVIAFTVLVKAEHVEVLVHAEVVLEGVWNKQIVEVFDGLLHLIDLVPDIVFLLGVTLALFGSFAVLEDVEE